jgi:hypothetical protein
MGPIALDFGSSTNGSSRQVEKKTDLKLKVITIEAGKIDLKPRARPPDRQAIDLTHILSLLMC